MYACIQDPGRNSNRPFETVEQLAVKLGMQPRMDDRSVSDSGVFDNEFKKTHYKAGITTASLAPACSQRLRQMSGHPSC